MRFKKVVSLVLVFVFAIGSFQTFAFAQSENIGEDRVITIEFYNEVSDEVKERVVAHFHGKDENIVHQRGLTCTLFGHKLETGTTSVVTHKVRTSAPRCLRETFDYEICSRCDYSEYTLIGDEYISCC